MTEIESKNGLSDKQRRAIAALLSEPTGKAAAKAAKGSEATIYRWQADPMFSATLKEARGRALESTLTSLQGASGQAVSTLVSVMTDDQAQTSARVSAARTVLEMTLKARDQLELSERLVYLEKLFAIRNEG